MKLELKHIAPYLPYGLKMMETHSKKIGQVSDIFTLGYGYNEDDIKICVDGSGDEHIWMFKPILRPLSDLSQRHVEAWHSRTIERLINQIKKQDVEYCVMLELFEEHYDVFGLIDKGLAVNINILNGK